MNINSRREKIIRRLRDKEHRDAYVEAQIDIGIPFQIRALREQREETQSKVSERTGWAQAWISKLENPNYRRLTLASLKKVASAFDVGLVVRFVPISELVEWELNLSNQSLFVPSFNEDPYFKEPTVDTQATGHQGEAKRDSSNLIALFSRRTPKSVEDAAMGEQSHHGAFYLQSQEEKGASALS